MKRTIKLEGSEPLFMELIHGNKDIFEAEQARRFEKRKNALRRIMLEETNIKKVLHAAVRWYRLRNEGETEPKNELRLYNVCLELMSQQSPQWLKQEFPPSKTYNGEGEFRDYYTTLEAIEDAGSGFKSIQALMTLLMEYENRELTFFTVAGLMLMNEARHCDLFEDFVEMEGLGLNPPPIYQSKIKKPRHGLKLVKGARI